MPVFESKLQSSETIAVGTQAFHLHKPDGFRFLPGQSISLVLTDASGLDRRDRSHTFSLVSEPFDDRLTVATRMRDSPFKRALKALPIGGAVQIRGPNGSMSLDGDVTRPAVFLAGGIGITPFVSMLRQQARDGMPRRLHLFYSNRTPEDAAFLAELRQLAERNPNFGFVPTMTGLERAHEVWAGETLRIGTELLAKHISDLAAPIYYVAGPPGMVGAVRELLGAAGVGGDAIRSEEFFGY